MSKGVLWLSISLNCTVRQIGDGEIHCVKKINGFGVTSPKMCQGGIELLHVNKRALVKHQPDVHLEPKWLRRNSLCQKMLNGFAATSRKMCQGGIELLHVKRRALVEHQPDLYLEPKWLR